MDSLVSSLSTSFKDVPLAAIPAMLDCILASTGLSPSSLFAALLDSSALLVVDDMIKGQELGSDQCNDVASLATALCHLLKKFGADSPCLRSFVWRCFIPLLRAHAFDRGLLNEIAESFLNVVMITNSWTTLETTVVPFLLRSVGLSMDMLQQAESDAFKWGPSSLFQNADGTEDGQFKCVPLPVSCYILTLILDAAIRNLKLSPTQERITHGCSYGERISGNLLWDLCCMSERLLLQSSDHRSCTIAILLPNICKAFTLGVSFEISIHESSFSLTRHLFLGKVWKCCKTLFPLGSSERRDAYSMLSICSSFFWEESDIADSNNRTEEFDVRADRQFWEEIKSGLVEEERLIRKQSLEILKNALHINGDLNTSTVSETLPQGDLSNPQGLTKRESWADKEAKSLGVGKFCSSVDSPLTCQQQWKAFILLYEMLEEYGTHLVEAAWNHQVTLLLQLSSSDDNFADTLYGTHQRHTETAKESFAWLAILWVVGFRHDNPQVRCLIMQSFLAIDWITYGDAARSVPESFILGPFIDGLNDPIHHKEFGVKGVYTSKTIIAAGQFVRHYTSCQSVRNGVTLVIALASVVKHRSISRAGLMGLAECLASAALGLGKYESSEIERNAPDLVDKSRVKNSLDFFSSNDKSELLEVLRFVLETSRQHFNPNYRLRVSMKIFEAAASLVCISELPLEIVLRFISAFPREFTDHGGTFRARTQEWLLGSSIEHERMSNYTTEFQLLKSFQEFPFKFVSGQASADAALTYDDEDLNAWEVGAKRWARVLFTVVRGEAELAPVLTSIHDLGVSICKQQNLREWLPIKYLVLCMSLISEIELVEERAAEHCTGMASVESLAMSRNLCAQFMSILEELVSFANMSCPIFWANVGEDVALPGTVRGKLGGPSQRRLASVTTTAVLQAIKSVQVVASVSAWCIKSKSAELNSSWMLLWSFFKKVISSPTQNTETGAEVGIAAYEALSYALKSLASTFSQHSFDLVRENNKSLHLREEEPWLDVMVLSFLQNVNNLLAVGAIARSRRAVLLKWKWLCLESLLSIPDYAMRNALQLEDASFFSDRAIKSIFDDLVESLENAAEVSLLPMLRCVRLAIRLLASGKLGSLTGVDVQMMWPLVRSSWVLLVNWNKRRVASIAAVLSSVLHASLFADEAMHMTDNVPGPLKWFIDNLLEEGTRSPRTVRLAALHLTGLWLSHPRITMYYIKELKLLTLYGSVAFDEDFEAELVENYEARTEVSLLANNPDPELTEEFINTELYARVSVAALFQKLGELADLVGTSYENEECRPALESGKLFLMELLDSAVNDRDLSKELYKKYSAIHRRKIRVWQMICVLSRFVTEDIVEEVTKSMHVALCKNNLPAVRQYLETFAINIFLKFPPLVGKQLVPILQDYEMRPQALSSYVFIAANIILHSSTPLQSRHLDELLPPIIPLLTSHHHSLRGFTQLLVYQVLCRYFSYLDSGTGDTQLEKRCFEDLKLYLAVNPDCKRLRESMEGYLEAYNPITSSTPAGIFVNRVEKVEFECVPTSLMEELLGFLNDAREDLRSAMAKDLVAIKNESLKIDRNPDSAPLTNNGLSHEMLDFQKKITLSTNEPEGKNYSTSSGNNKAQKQLLEMEKEIELLDQAVQTRRSDIKSMSEGRQQFIVVASLVDRIPNLAGLARTCEIFKASGLVIADATVLRDKQFQLISVTAEKWVPIMEVPVHSVKQFLEKKKREGFSVFGLEQTANSVPLDQFEYPQKTVLVLGREKEGIPVDIIHVLDACVEIPQLGVVRSLNVHVSGAIALWEYTRQQRSQ
ncbi:Probable methyltransferase TARBP1 [Linum perenne]